MKPPVSGLGCVGGKVDHDQISANAKTKGTITEEQVVAQVLPSLQSLPRIDAVTSYRGIRQPIRARWKNHHLACIKPCE